MVIENSGLVVANMNGIAIFCRTNTRTLVDFLAIVNSFAVMAQYGAQELTDVEIIELTRFWEAK